MSVSGLGAREREMGVDSQQFIHDSAAAMSAHTKALLQMHACIVLWGFTAILGKLISLRALPLVFWRMLLVSGALVLLPRVWSGVRRMPARLIGVYTAIGVLVMLHWLAFYGSIKLSNASVAASCIALCPMFTSLLEPLIVSRPFVRAELLFGAASGPSVALVVGATPSGLRLGILLGILSALLATVFGTLNKRFIGDRDALAVTALEMAAGALLLALIAPLLPASEPVFVWPDARDSGLLLALALACTLLPFALSLVALRQLSVFTSALALNLEPVYSIVLASLLFGEQRELGAPFYLGVGAILSLVVVHTLAEPWARRRVTR